MSDPHVHEDLEDLYETAPCGYVSVAPDGRIVKVNRTLCDWLDRPSEAVVGSSIHDLLSFGGKIAYETHLAPLLRMQGYVYEIALDVLHRDGTKIPVIANAAEKREADDRHLFTRLTLFKAVDRRTYERSLVEARIRAEEAARAEHDLGVLREQFVAVLGHDLRNPLSAIRAGIEIVERSEALSDRAAAVLKNMRSSVDRASELVADVLDLARGRLGQGIAISPDSSAPLAPVLRQVVSELRTIFPERPIEARFDIEEPVHCDRDRVGQLVSNLLSNALTHGQEGSPVRLEAWSEEDVLSISVANGGRPIPEEVRSHLFQPFFRGALRPGRKGLGLGLFIAAEIARAHGGRIDVRSDEEETRFTLVMPLRDGGVEQASESRGSSG